MSKHQVDNITNLAGDGLPSLNGTSPEIKWQKKHLTANHTVDGTISDLTFNNLVIGRTYRYSTKFMLVVNNGASDPFVDVAVSHDGATLERQGITLRGGGSSAEVVRTAGHQTFVATATSLSFVSSSTTANSYVSSGVQETYVILEELPYHTETSDFT